ncbi:MAG: acylneuraminate cytidylyltransferase [Bacteroidales bacterium]|nr:acylneuraminate cytidylyltransferase [Bacteroidales bacterium]
MFRKVLFAAAVTLSLTSAFNASAQRNDWANFARFEQENKELLSKPQTGRLVVFLGNSITEGWAGQRPEFFETNGFAGRGISGQTTYQFLSRFRDDVINLHPKLLVLNAATNDIAENTHPYSEDRTFGNIVSMVELAKANGIKVILTSTLPAAGFGWNPSIKDAPEKINSLNARIKAYAAKNKIPYVDYHSSLLGADGRSLDSKYSNDGVHPTAAGYEVMEALILPAVRKIVK